MQSEKRWDNCSNITTILGVMSLSSGFWYSITNPTVRILHLFAYFVKNVICPYRLAGKPIQGSASILAGLNNIS